MSDIYLDLYRNKRAGDCLVQRYLRSRGVGKFIKVSAEEMRQHGLEIVLSHLQSDLSHVTDKPEMATFSKEEEKIFYRQHYFIGILTGVQGPIKLCPMHRKGSGFVAPKDNVVELPHPCSNEMFLDALNRICAEL